MMIIFVGGIEHQSSRITERNFKRIMRENCTITLRILLMVTLFVLSIALYSNAQTQSAPYRLQMHVKVPMRDGTHLDATVYRPVEDSGPLPVIVMMTPYPDYIGHPSGAYFAAHGYIYASVDVRGRGDSEGSFDPFAHDADDGYDTVEWLASQPWSNGKVGMFGGSYAGGDQWLTASTKPPHLVTIVPAASARAGVDFPFFHNIFETYAMQWLTLTSGKVLYLQAFTDDALWNGVNDRFFLDKVRFGKLDVYAGNTNTVFKDWIQHPTPDDYWEARGGTRGQIAAIQIPVLEITGQHDDDQEGALSFHTDYASGMAASRPPDYLVVGPWDHVGTRDPKQDVGTDNFGPENVSEHYERASLLDLLRLHREWYDYTMKGRPLPGFLQNKFAYYVGGVKAECWKYADSMEAISTKSMTFYLDGTDDARSVYQSGSLVPVQSGAHGGEWLSDPNDLSAATLSNAERSERLHGNGMIFHTTPFIEDKELDGRMDLRVWLSIDAPDTDLLVSLYLIKADGKVHPLDQNIMRARYRHGLLHEEAIHQNSPEEYRFDNGNFFAIRAEKGDRLRLIITSLNDPSMEKNWNSMKPVLEQSGADARVAHIHLVQDAKHPSMLTVLVGDLSLPCKASADW